MKIEQLKQYIENRKIEFNGFKRIIDRKYFVYDIFRFINYQKYLFKCEKYIGSNQIILYYNDKEVYNSIKDNFNPLTFKTFMFNQLKNLLNIKPF